MDLETISGPVLEVLTALITDPIPNIRFNVAKSLEELATTYGTTPAGKTVASERIAPALQGVLNDSDADVRYYAGRALESTLRTINSGM